MPWFSRPSDVDTSAARERVRGLGTRAAPEAVAETGEWWVDPVPEPRQDTDVTTLDRVRRRVADAVPATARQSRVDPGRRGLAVIIGVAVVAAAVTGFFMWRSRPEPVAVPEGHVTQPSASTGGEVVVAVSGAVTKPGLVRLRAGDRVADAIEKAGGVKPGTDLGQLNLARKVVDGELIVVGTPPGGEQPTPDDPGTAPGGDAPRVDLNTATPAQLDALPGVGPVLAQSILDYRRAHGSFRRVDELREVDGIGETRFARLEPLVTV